jgi:2-polyprenyl-3-methyl-5-hydroxy-6-metoxy-1,4-benzoquinol methylase
MSTHRDISFENIQKFEFDRFFHEIRINPSDDLALSLEFSTLLQFIGMLEGKRVLDLGCGIGRNGLQLAKYAEEVVGYDISEVGVARANTLAKELNIPNFRAEVNNFSVVEERYFDTILCVNMLHHSASPPRVLSAIRQALRPGGQLIVMENNPLNLLFPLFFLLIGQIKSHWTKQYLMVNRFTLANLITSAGMSVKKIECYGFLPTMLYNYSLKFKSLNEFLNRIPVINEATAFHLIKAERS